MNKLSFFTTLIVLGIFCGDLKSQTKQSKTGNLASSDYYANLKPGDPEHAALGSFGKTPINYYAGLPEVSLSLLNLTSRDLSLPISINYDASGVKISDISGPVGIKWNLNTGGYVARQMNGGYADEDPTYGYWLSESLINNFVTYPISTKITWVTPYERNDRDYEPDEFVLYVNGRSIKFLMKNHVPFVIPQQNVNITYNVVNGKIDNFQFIDENGTKYSFGGSSTTIEQRKVENLSISAKYDYLNLQDVSDNTKNFNTGIYGFNIYPTLTEKSGQFYNDKWYLVSITSASGDQINFTYANDGTQKYVTTPSIARIDKVANNIQTFQYPVGGSTSSINGVMAYALFNQDCTTNYYDALPCETGVDAVSVDWPGFSLIDWSTYYPNQPKPSANITQDQTGKYIDPLTQNRYPEPGGVFINQSLITESIIRLTGISTSVGNRIALTTSSRSDLPSAYKYDQLDLYNVNNQLVKSIKLNFATIDANLSRDYLWLSEGLMASKIKTFDNRALQPNTNGNLDYYAHHFYKPGFFTDADINWPGDANWPGGATSNSFFKKYTYEGLREYNFKRLFLESVIEITNSNQRTLYSFAYNNRTNLKRRNAPYGSGLDSNPDQVMYPTTYPSGETPIVVTNSNINNGNGRAMIIQAYNPSGSNWATSSLDGILKQISYPTGGKTEFTFNYNGSLKNVIDRDENDAPMQSRELEYLSTAFNAKSITTSCVNVSAPAPNASKFIQIKTVSSAPQNKTYRQSAGVFTTYSKVKVYNGIATNHKGYEIFSYSWDGDQLSQITTPDYTTSPVSEITPYSGDVFPFPRAVEKDHLRGLLTGHDVYDKDGHFLKSTVNEYETKNKPEYNITAVNGFFAGSTSSFLDGNVVNRRYGIYQITNDRVFLKKTTEKTYDQNFGSPQDLNKNISRITDYTYDNTSLQLTQTTTYNELTSGSTVSTVTKYPTHPDYNYSSYCVQQYNTCMSGCSPFDVTCMNNCAAARDNCLNGSSLPADAGAIVGLQSNHQINSPVEIQNWIQEGSTSKLVSAVVYKYNREGATFFPKFIKPKEIWGLKQPLDLYSFSTSKINSDASFSLDPKMRKLHRYDLYDQTTSNLLQQTSLDGTVSSYQWGFNNSLLTGATVNSGGLQQQTLYDYTPLKGLIQSTDPNGRKTFYTYDNYNRLKLTRDHDSNILNRYRYHYLGQDEFLNGAISVSGCKVVGQQVTFSCSDNPEFGQTTYTWDFGDGSPSATSSYVSHSYTSAGNYTVTLRKNNPEQFANDQTIQLVINNSLTSLNICADGPVKVDACGTISTIYGTCTTSNNTPSSTTILKATVDPLITSYQWQYQLNGAGSWISLGTGISVSAPSGFLSRTLGNYSVRCIGYDACGNSVNSATILLAYFKSNCP